MVIPLGLSKTYKLLTVNTYFLWFKFHADSTLIFFGKNEILIRVIPFFNSMENVHQRWPFALRDIEHSPGNIVHIRLGKFVKRGVFHAFLKKIAKHIAAIKTMMEMAKFLLKFGIGRQI